MRRKRDDEQTKLTANWLNTLAAAAITIGVIGPLAAMIASYPSPLFGLGNIVIGIAVWLATGLGLHWAARYMLDGLSDDDN